MSMNKIWKSLKSDRADGVLIMFIIAIPLFVLLLGFAINVNSSIQAKNEYNAMAQTAAQTSIKTINANGSLGNGSVETFISEYRKQYTDGHLPVSDECKTMKVDGVSRTLPYYVVTLETGRGLNGVNSTQSWTVEGTGTVPTKTLTANTKYRVLSAKVYTSSTNIFGVFGLPACQLHASSISAIAFGSQSDLS